MKNDIIESEEMAPEHDFSAGERGKFAAQYAQGSNLVVLAPEVAAVLRAANAANLPAILPAPMLQLQGAPALQLGWHVVALTNPRPHRTIAAPRPRRKPGATRVCGAFERRGGRVIETRVSCRSESAETCC